MSSRINDSMRRTNELNHIKQKVPNWVVIVGGALLSILSIRLCCRLKKVFDFKRGRKAHTPSKDNGNSTLNKRRNFCSEQYCFTPDEDGGYQCFSAGAKHTPASSMTKDGDDANNGEMRESLTHLLELPAKPFKDSNAVESPSLSESGSDISSKKEVVQKLRRQLKRRDDMIVEMQAQITDLQTSLIVEMDHSTHLQAQLDSSNRKLFDSEREIQRLRSCHF